MLRCIIMAMFNWWNNSTVKDACELAESMGIPNLILYHSEDKSFPYRKKLYSAEGRQYYSGNLFIPDDDETFQRPLLWQRQKAMSFHNHFG